MTGSSPFDLAVAFRSVPRRLHEARGDTPADAIAGPEGSIRSLFAEAGRLMGTTDDPEAIAAAIHDHHPDDWDEAVLERLRTIALDLGRLLRQIEALGDGG